VLNVSNSNSNSNSNRWTTYLQQALWCSLLVSPLALAADNPPVAVDDVASRFVWAGKLILRSQPDSKSAEIGRVPYGAKVVLQPDAAPLIRHQEILFTLQNGATAKAGSGNVILDGNWRHVHYQEQDGWLFDGYLSRYPAPPVSSGENDAIELEHAKRVFGDKASFKWVKGESKVTDSYRLLQKHGAFCPLSWCSRDVQKSASEYTWQYTEFKQGGTYESVSLYDGGGAGNIDFKNLPLTFNEALLWLRRFSALHPTGAGVVGTGVFTPGRRVEIGPTEEEAGSISFTSTVDCAADKCTIHEDASD